MGQHVKIGDRLQVVFAPADWGVQTKELINGRPAFATDSGPMPLEDDLWEVMVVGMNPDRTAYLVEPIDLVEAADGLSSVLKPYLPFYHEFIRASEARLALLLSNVGPQDADADADADALDEILSNCLLPEAYKADLLSRFEAQRELLTAS